MKVIQELVLRDGGKVVRYDPPSDVRGLVKNLECFNGDGSSRWKIAPAYNNAGQSDFFVFVRLDNDLVVANTYGGWGVWIDPNTGVEIKSQFFK